MITDMSNFTMTLQVNIGITPSLENLLTRLLTTSAEAAEITAKASRANIEASEKSIEAYNAYLQTLSDTPIMLSETATGIAYVGVNQPSEAVQEPTQPTEAAQEPTQPTETPTEAPAPVEAAAPDYSVMYVRDAIDRTRRRIEGENYKQETTSELYKKYHKALTGEFKRIATQLSANTDNPTEKPTELPNDLRGKFVEACDEIYINDNGELEIKLPF